MPLDDSYIEGVAEYDRIKIEVTAKEQLEFVLERLLQEKEDAAINQDFPKYAKNRDAAKAVRQVLRILEEE